MSQFLKKLTLKENNIELTSEKQHSEWRNQRFEERAWNSQLVWLCEVCEQKKKDEKYKFMTKEDKRKMAITLKEKSSNVKNLTNI